MAGLFFQQYSKLSVPIPLANLKLWLKADAGISLNDTTVSVWADQSGLGNNVSQGEATRQPLFVPGYINGQPSIYFETNDYLKSSSFTELSQPNTLIIVYKSLADTSLSFIFDGISSKKNALFTTINRLYMAGYTNLSYSKNTPFSDFITTTAYYNGINSQIFENGISKNNGNAGVLGIDGFSIGSYQGTASYPFKGYISEVIFYNSLLGTTERQQVENYLKSKYAHYL